MAGATAAVLTFVSEPQDSIPVSGTLPDALSTPGSVYSEVLPLHLGMPAATYDGVQSRTVGTELAFEHTAHLDNADSLFTYVELHRDGVSWWSARTQGLGEIAYGDIGAEFCPFTFAGASPDRSHVMWENVCTTGGGVGISMSGLSALWIGLYPADWKEARVPDIPGFTFTPESTVRATFRTVIPEAASFHDPRLWERALPFEDTSLTATSVSGFPPY